MALTDYYQSYHSIREVTKIELDEEANYNTSVVFTDDDCNFNTGYYILNSKDCNATYMAYGKEYKREEFFDIISLEQKSILRNKVIDNLLNDN